MPSPPKYPLRFLHWFCKTELVEEIEGDLNEEFEERVQCLGTEKARWIFAWQVLSFFRPYAIKLLNLPIFNFIPMYLHYLKVAYRNLRKQKVPGLIKTIGLAIGLSTCLLIIMYVNYELDFDRFHDKPEDIFRLTLQDTREDGVKSNSVMIPMGMLPDIVAQVPEIEYATSFGHMGSNLRIDDKILRGIRGIDADSSFFKVFQFPLKNGLYPDFPQTPNDILLTESLAERLFGNQNPLGESVKFWTWKDTTIFEVKGILKDPPSQSHIQFEFVYPQKEKEWTYTWEGYRMRNISYLRKNESSSVEALQESLDSFTKATGGAKVDKHLGLHPLLDIHLRSDMDDHLSVKGDMRDIYLFSGIALLILFIALINYILTVSADFGRRIKEIGIRKATGALRKNIIGQFFTETFLYVVLSIPLAAIMVYIALPSFSDLVNRPLSFHILTNQWSLWVLSLGILVVLFLSGTYPAYLLSRMNTVDSIKGKLLNINTSKWVRHSLLLIQFVITLALMGSLTVIYKQINFINKMDLGFERKNKLVLSIGYNNQNTSSLKQKILQHSAVQAASLTSWVPPTIATGFGTFKHPETDDFVEVWLFDGDEDLIKAYGLGLAEGRSFRPIPQNENKLDKSEIGSEDSNSVEKEIIVNQALLKSLGLENVLGEQLKYPSFKGKLIGVIEDFNIRSIHDPIKPMAYTYTDQANNMIIAYQEGKEKEVLDYIQEAWHSFDPDTPLNFFFLDEHLEKHYDKENRLLTMISVFAFLAIALACLGVFGLASISAERRTKEIGIRKVLGANLSHILLLLNKDFVKLIMLAILVAIPISVYFMYDWLQQFAYRISIQPWEFLITAFVVLGIVILTVSIRSLTVAMANPVKALRQE